MSGWRRWAAGARWVVALAPLLLASPVVAAEDGDAYTHDPPSTPMGAVGLGIKAWSDDVNSAVAAATWTGEQPLSLSAAAGEVEPATFVVYARRNVRRLDVRVSELAGKAGRIPASAVGVREVLRVPTRRRFARPETDVVGRFLPLLEPSPLSGGHLREVWLEVTVPLDAQPGVYTARVSIDVDGDEIVRLLRLRVRPIRLRTPRHKQLGMSYRMFASVHDEERTRRELRDMREHGVEHLLTDLRPTFERGADGEVLIDVTRVAQGLDLVVSEGFGGTVVVDSGLVPLARILGHDDVGYRDATGASLQGEGGAAFRRHALRTMRALRAEARAHPQIDVAVKHLDEIFGRDRLDLFVELASVSRRVRGLPIFAAFSTMTAEEDAWRARVDPFVDLRGNHGYTFEWWIARGHDWDDYSREVRSSGDRAWFYHNQRGTYFTARWARLVNGIYLWAGPFGAHITWVYQKFHGDPFDDTDGPAHDFGVAFPDPADARVLIPTREWSAIREGWDDLRYLETLRVAIERHRRAAPGTAAEARAFLDRLQADVLRVPGPLDPDLLRKRVGSPDEAPIVHALAQRYDGGALDLLRERVEELVVALEVSGHSVGRRARR